MRTSALVGDLVRHLRSRILGGEFAPDDRVSESGIATEYSVARPTARSALDLLVLDGLLVRNAYSALRIPTISTTDIAEILAILEFSERRAVDRLFQSDADMRAIRDAASASLHQLLDALVQAAESARLARIHRQCTFELILGMRQANIPEPEIGTATRERMTQLAEALFSRDRVQVDTILDALLLARRSVGEFVPSSQA